MKEKNTAQSDFAKTKTIREQREFLPVFTVRDDLLAVVRENQVTVIVGETGSGTYTCIFFVFAIFFHPVNFPYLFLSLYVFLVAPPLSTLSLR